MLGALIVTLAVAIAAPFQEAPMKIVVNGADQGIIRVLTRDGDVWVPIPALETAGLRQIAGRQETRQNLRYVSLTSLAPAVRFELDDNTVTLRITAAPELMTATVKDLRSDPGEASYRRQNNFFLNYSLHVQSDRSFSGTFDGAANAGSALAMSDFSLSAGKLVRGFTSVSHDDPGNLRRWVVGDSLTGATALMPSVPQLGVAVSRNFSLNPYFVPGPAFDFTTDINTPSTVEVYVNGVLVSRQEVSPGPLQLKNLPVTRGSGTVRVVIRDAFGHEQEVIQPFYFASGLLAPHVSEFTYSAGVIRNGVLGQRTTYGEPLVSANQRLGLTRTLTGGYFFQRSNSSACGGVAATARLLAGQLDAEIGASRARGRSGAAGSAAYVFFGSRGSVGSTLRIQSIDWTTPGNGARVPREVALFANVPVAKGFSASGHYSASSVSHRIVLMANRGGERISGFASLERVHDKSGARFGTRAGITLNLGPLRTASVYVDKTGSSVQVTRSVGSGSGYGYRLEVRPGPNRDASGEVDYQNDRGRFDVGGGKTASGATAFADVSGSILSIGGRTFLSRTLGDGFALIRVPGVAGVRAYFGSQEVGRTDRRGDLVVPNLVPYYRNEIRVGAQGIPFNYSFTAMSQTLAPTFKSGAVVEFPLNRLQAVTGRIRIHQRDGDVVPTFGTLTISGMESPLGSAGDFYFEKLQAGDYAAEVQRAGLRCTFRFHVPASQEDINDVGDVVVDCPPR